MHDEDEFTKSLRKAFVPREGSYLCPWCFGSSQQPFFPCATCRSSFEREVERAILNESKEPVA